METKTLGECLEKYQGGIWRALVRREPSHKRLLKFHGNLESKKIVKIEGEHLDRLITILFKKNNKSGTTASSDLCINVAAYFGGYDALMNLANIKLLNAKATQDPDSITQLNKATVDMMLEYPQHAKLLTKIWVTAKTEQLKQLINVNYLSRLAQSLQKVDPERINYVWEMLEKVFINSEENFIECVALINRLHDNEYPVTEAVIKKIEGLPSRVLLDDLLDRLLQKDPSFKQQIATILEIKNPSLLLRLIKDHPNAAVKHVQSWITTFSQNTLTTTELVNCIGECFSEHKWSIDKYLPALFMLPATAPSDELVSLLKKIAELFQNITHLGKKEQSDCLELVLSNFLKHPDYAADITYAAERLIEAKQMNLGCLKMVLKEPKMALKRASALKNMGTALVKDDCIEFIRKSGEHAEGAGEFYLQYTKLTYRKNLLEKIEQHLDVASTTAKILAQLISQDCHHYQPFINYLIDHLKDTPRILPAINHLVEANNGKLEKSHLKALTECKEKYLQEAKKITGTAIEETIVNPGRSRHGFNNANSKKAEGEMVSSADSTPASVTLG